MMLLDGLRVLDLSRVLAGPLAAQILGDLGADVLKVESPAGDDTRTWGPPFQGETAAYFQSCNRNKSSLVLDLKSSVDRGRLEALVVKADVVLDNFQPLKREHLGVTPEHLAALNPQLVWCGIVGYGGHRADDPGYDLMVQAEAGLMGITGPVDGEPYKVGTALVDVMTGMMAANGVLAACWRRERLGIGARLDLTLYRTALYSLVNVASSALVSGKPSPRCGNAHANIVPYQDFLATDGHLVIGVGNDRQYRKLCQVLGVDDPHLIDLHNAARVDRRHEIIAALQAVIATRSRDTLRQQLQQAGIPCAPILRPDEALRAVSQWDPDALLAVENARGETVRMVNNPLTYAGMRTDHRPPPALGEGGEETAKRWLDAEET